VLEIDLEEAVMTPQEMTNEAFDQSITAIPTCALDEAGIRGQRAGTPILHRA
jgi:hypothetical protein